MFITIGRFKSSWEEETATISHLSICCALTSFCLVNIFHDNVIGNCEFSLKYVKLRGLDGEAVLGAFGLLKYSIEMIPHGGS